MGPLERKKKPIVVNDIRLVCPNYIYIIIILYFYFLNNDHGVDINKIIVI